MKNNERYITRCDYENAKGCRLLLPNINRQGKKKSGKNKNKSIWFRANVYGSIDKACRAAIVKRDTFLMERNAMHLLNEPLNRSSMRSSTRNRTYPNSSGIVGVAYSDRCGEWLGYYQKNYKQVVSSFRTHRTGDEAAFHKACKARYKGTGKPLVVNNLNVVPYKIKVPYRVIT